MILNWMRNARHVALPQSVLPALVAVALSYHHVGFSWPLALAAVIGAALAHLGMNLTDDYFDYLKKGADVRASLTSEGMRARMAKCEYLTSGRNTVQELRFAIGCFALAALSIGAIACYFRGINIVYITASALLLGYFYSGTPLRLSYRGGGELTIGAMFGPLLMTGVYYMACGEWNLDLLFISIPIGLLVANIVYTHAIMDYAPDKKMHKMTLAVVLDNTRGMLVASFFFLFSPFAIVAAGVTWGILSPYYLCTFITLPMAIGLYRLIIAFTHNPKQEYSPRRWMGPMENWDKIKEAGISWFMIRWYLARNIITLFALIIAIVALLV